MFSHIAAAFVILLSLGAGRFTSEPSSEDKIVTLELRPIGNELEFEQKEIRAKAGQKIRVVFTNTSSVMPHNVVILDAASAIDRVGVAAMTAENYIPEDEAILAYTSVAGPGETVEVAFTAPAEPGEYPFICTVPGHYYMMRGILKVTG